MDILFLAFANDRDNPLPALQREDETIYSLLAPRQAQQHFLVHRDSFTNLNSITEYLDLYKDNIVVFHYSGHASPGNLQLEGPDAHALGIAELLSHCPRLQLVVLNGCSTAAQVQGLLDKGVPVVISTYAPIEDQKAAEFSIQFYRTLANQDTIEQAFEAAKGKILTMDSQVSFHRGLDVDGDGADSALWGIFWKNDPSLNLEWSLPSIPYGYSSGEYQPNLMLVDSMVNALAEYNDPIKQIKENESMGVEVGILDKREAILKALPHPISEQVRKLLVPESAGTNSVFYDKPGPDRLRQMVAVYETITDLFAYIMLAQLWDALNERPTLQITDELRGQVKQFLTLTPQQRRVYDFLPLVRNIRLLFDKENIPYFLEELSHLRKIAEPGQPFYEAWHFMDSMKRKIADAMPGKAEADNLCIMAEEKLAVILGETGFIGRYTFASVKNITVVKSRQLREARFKHTIVRLVQRFVGLAEEPQIMERFMDNTSVLLLREQQGGPKFLNLTPFVIDENAFDEKASIAKLHFFERYAKDQDAYAYRHIYKPSDIPLVVAKQANYLVLKAQFDAFAQLLFHQPMQKAI
ncbi:MAG: CHAT domain-containing protein [Saprospiraceae bacterium]|nr:CHAT domain-containing protein [Saprospiraceae bacterium]